VLGVSIYNQQTQTFEFKDGPIFANIVLADEINRTTPRTQSALLEAMSEEQVSVESQTRRLPRPFMIIATQNPFEFEGTYYLPENQLDRFLIRITIGYPDRGAEHRILTVQPGRTRLEELRPVMTADEVVELQDRVPQVRVDQAVLDYVLDIVDATRHEPQLHLGVSPRGGLALTQAAQAAALLQGRDYVVPDDVKGLVLPVCAHRVLSKTYLHNGDSQSTTRILQQVLDTVPTPT
jgi:MoxR-like ATPase